MFMSVSNNGTNPSQLLMPPPLRNMREGDNTPLRDAVCELTTVLCGGYTPEERQAKIAIAFTALEQCVVQAAIDCHDLSERHIVLLDAAEAVGDLRNIPGLFLGLEESVLTQAEGISQRIKD
jgi:hypothetical protein